MYLQKSWKMLKFNDLELQEVTILALVWHQRYSGNLKEFELLSNLGFTVSLTVLSLLCLQTCSNWKTRSITVLMSNFRLFYFLAPNCLTSCMGPSVHWKNRPIFFSLICTCNAWWMSSHLLLPSCSLYLAQIREKNLGQCSLNDWTLHVKIEAVWSKKIRQPAWNST